VTRLDHADFSFKARAPYIQTPRAKLVLIYICACVVAKLPFSLS
jgi:hypothetical protein